MLTLSYLKDVENVVYGPEKEIVPQLAADLLIPNLDEAVEGFRRSPVKEGLILKGGRRSSVKLFIPDLYFDQHIDMGRTCGCTWGRCPPPTASIGPGTRQRNRGFTPDLYGKIVKRRPVPAALGDRRRNGEDRSEGLDSPAFGCRSYMPLVLCQEFCQGQGRRSNVFPRFFALFACKTVFSSPASPARAEPGTRP